MSPEENYQLLKWLHRNRRELLRLYKNQYVAYTFDRMLAHGENLDEVLAAASATGELFGVYRVPPRSASVQILPVYFRSITRHDWQPNYHVKLTHREHELSIPMLVDSGAELSLISYNIGQDLGFALADSESRLLAETIGGRVEYVLRDVEMTINERSFIAPVAWLQNPTDGEQLLLGREVVFDRFNIEFRQAEERIIFTWRE